jgi:hypothetical protein
MGTLHHTCPRASLDPRYRRPDRRQGCHDLGHPSLVVVRLALRRLGRVLGVHCGVLDSPFLLAQHGGNDYPRCEKVYGHHRQPRAVSCACLFWARSDDTQLRQTYRLVARHVGLVHPDHHQQLHRRPVRHIAHQLDHHRQPRCNFTRTPTRTASRSKSSRSDASRRSTSTRVTSLVGPTR